MATIIRNGTIVTAEDVFRADLVMDNGKIREITASAAASSGDEAVDAEGCYLFPGGVDPHTHLDGGLSEALSPDNFADGSRAAAVGGITTVINYTNHRPEQTLLEDLEEWKHRAAPSVIDYGFHSTITHFRPEHLDELQELLNRGVSSLKVFMAYGPSMIGDGNMYRLLRSAHRSGMLVNVHAENGDIIDERVPSLMASGCTAPKYHADSRPPMLEAEAVHRAAVIAEAAGTPLYIVHLTSEAALREVVLAQSRGVQIIAETCPQYLTLDRSQLELDGSDGLEGAKYVCSPPLRERSDQQALWDGIASGAVTVIGSDQCSFSASDKLRGAKKGFPFIPNGLPMIEEQFSVMYHFGVAQGRLTLPQFVALTSTNAARRFGLYPHKGILQAGADADVVVFDPAGSRVIRREEQQSKVDYNLYEGTEVQGVIRQVFSRGELIASGGKYTGRPARGCYLPRSRSI